MNIYLTLLIGSLLYGASYLFATLHLNISAAVFLWMTALHFYLQEHRNTGETLNLCGLLALGLLGGEGVACLKLSNLSTEWSTMTWLSFYCFYLTFYCIHEFLSHHDFSFLSRRSAPRNDRNTVFLNYRLSFYRSVILMLLILTWSSFFLEASLLGFIPFFTHDMPHAYSYFHIQGIHYFTTLFVLIPAIAVLYVSEKYPVMEFPTLLHSILRDPIAILGFLLPIVLSIFLVSRSQFLFTIILAVFTWILSGRRLKLWQYGIFLLLLIFVYVLITIARAHSIQYLNGIFDMKNEQLPIFITQPYIYIANNYDNFNLMTLHLEKHSYGLKMLYPFFTLSGLKFLIPSLNVAFPSYVTKEELTTVTLLYDAWYDFGLCGIVLLAAILGALSAFMTKAHHSNRNPWIRILYAQFAFYFIFSFFTIWFSLASTWFYLFVSFALWVSFSVITIRFRSDRSVT